jgi:hypothetical protein
MHNVPGKAGGPANTLVGGAKINSASIAESKKIEGEAATPPASETQQATNEGADADPARENKIRERAYWIWLREGLPHGRETEHWRQAEAEIDAENAEQQS